MRGRRRILSEEKARRRGRRRSMTGKLGRKGRRRRRMSRKARRGGRRERRGGGRGGLDSLEFSGIISEAFFA